MYGVARGIAYLLAGGTTIPISNSIVSFVGNGTFLGIPMTVLLTIILTAGMMYLLSQSRFGQHTYAIGANKHAHLRARVNLFPDNDALFLLLLLPTRPRCLPFL